ncbi:MULTISPECIES: hypothetical protein [Pseudoxanthomonas]|uniref:hypothetical protein n=1 Tax=Pseudoxanthomonas TaxID=83618 RepID=UPI0013913E6E|nr:MULTISPECIES: hypothetical protein [Pseudoxanthomonas]KAF1695566.1 hypothetical protein CSC62_10480 [Pseudoxanthomonas jiangsuensis]MCR6685087.1 hypothetical protein [Pseudoxanthomonas sp.]
MDFRLLTLTKDHRGCTLRDDGRPLAWYPAVQPALELARTLAAASRLREDRAVVLELSAYGQPPRRLPLD